MQSQKGYNIENREGAGLWMIKIICGMFLFLLLILHFIVNHLVAPQGLLTYADVLNYYRYPAIPFIEICFLVFAVAHSLIGLRSIVLDLNPSPRLMRWINVLLVLSGSIAFIYGIWLVVNIISKI